MFTYMYTQQEIGDDNSDDEKWEKSACEWVMEAKEKSRG